MATWTNPPTFLPGFANRVTAAQANQIFRDDLNYLYRAWSRKSIQSDFTTTTLGDVSGMSIPLAANEVYEFEAVIFYTAPTAGDLKIAWTVPSGATGAWGGLGRDITTTTNLNALSFSAFGDATTMSLGGTAVGETALVNGTVVNSSTPGNLQLRGAQVAASGTTSIVVNSFIVALRM